MHPLIRNPYRLNVMEFISVDMELFSPDMHRELIFNFVPDLDPDPSLSPCQLNNCHILILHNGTAATAARLLSILKSLYRDI